jgi:hypothetical protein
MPVATMSRRRAADRHKRHRRVVTSVSDLGHLTPGGPAPATACGDATLRRGIAQVAIAGVRWPVVRFVVRGQAPDGWATAAGSPQVTWSQR